MKRSHIWSTHNHFGLGALTRFIATQRVFVATAAIVVVVVVSSNLLSCFLWWGATGAVPGLLVRNAFVVAFVVAAPTALYLVSIIHAMTLSSIELTKLSNELRETHNNLIEASAAKSRLLASTSHELRTPLNAIIGFSDIIRNQTLGTCSNVRYIEYADHIYQSGQNLLRLINGILDLSKIESGKEHIDLSTEIDVSAMISKACQLLSVIAEKAQISLIVEDVSEPVLICGNEDLIRQILDNLIANGVKFTLPGGKVSIGRKTDQVGNVIVHVADTGIGMTPEEIRVAMDPFGQIDSTHSRKHHGTGLGLPLVKAMIELHGGKLMLESAPGAGTTVSFSIPANRVCGKVRLAVASGQS